MANEQQLTARQAAIVGAYTGITAGPFSDLHQLAEELLGRPIWTHEFASKELMAEMREAAKPLFLAIAASDQPR